MGGPAVPGRPAIPGSQAILQVLVRTETLCYRRFVKMTKKNSESDPGKMTKLYYRNW